MLSLPNSVFGGILNSITENAPKVQVCGLVCLRAGQNATYVQIFIVRIPFKHTIAKNFYQKNKQSP